MDAAQLLIRIGTVGMAQAEADLKKTGQNVDQSQKQMLDGLKIMGPVALGGTAAIIGLGIATTKMAGDFQQGLTLLETGAGESAANLKMVGDGIQQIALDTGETTGQLESGMFMIESAGYRGKAGLDALKNAAEGAKESNADLGTVANAETTIMTDYAKAHITSAQAVNSLLVTVQNGKTTMQDLSASLSAVLPAASAAGIGLDSVMAAMATMTGEGVPAADAATYLRQTIIALEAPSKQTKDALANVGLTTQQVADMMKKSLPDALQLIQDAVAKKFPPGSAAYVQALKNIAGGSKEMQGILDLTGDHLKTFQDNLTNTKGAVDGAGGSIKGWAATQADFNTKMDKAREAIEVLGEKIGAVLLPAVGTAASKFADFVGWIQGSSTGAQVLRPILIALAIAIGGALVAAFIAWAISAGAAAIATIAATWPILAIGAAIAALIAIIIILWVNWSTIWSAISKFATDIWNGLVQDWNDLGFAITATAQNIWRGISGFFKSGINDVIDLINGFIGFLDGLKVDIPGGPSIHLNIGKIPHLADGGTLLSGGTVLVGERGPELLQLPQGASVQPLSGRNAAAGSSKTIIINAARETIDTDALIRHDRMDNLLQRVGRAA